MIHRLSAMRTLLLAIVLFAIPALACDLSFSTAAITNAVTSKDVKGDKFEPVGITDTYPADQGKFHAVVTVSNAPSDTVVKAVWIAVDVGSAAAPNTKIDETEVKVEGSRNVDFTLTPNAGQWPPGSYKVDLYLNGKLDRTLNFAVAAPPPTSKGGCPPLPPAVVKPSGIVSNVTMALGTKGDTKDPVNPTLVFQPNSVFHAVVAIQNAPKNTKFKAAWFATDVGSAADCNTAMDDTEFSTDGTRNIDFTLAPSTTWPAGTYRVEIYVNGNLDRVVNFSVK
jgi:outer membrane usher protein FimD/PapC